MINKVAYITLLISLLKVNSSFANTYTFNGYLTGYSYWSNSPAASGAIAKPILHDTAGGIGTYQNPITIAVGWNSSGWFYRPGTIIYVKRLQKYAIVEDVCGACKASKTKLDIWIDGKEHSRKQSRDCAYSITGKTEFIVNPPDNLPVIKGSVIDTVCKN